jgi:hypothetical protein
MSPTVQRVYNEVIRALSPQEQLQVATLILNELVQQDGKAIDSSDTWTEQDRKNVVDFSLGYAASLFSDEEAV